MVNGVKTSVLVITLDIIYEDFYLLFYLTGPVKMRTKPQNLVKELNNFCLHVKCLCTMM